MKIIIDAEPQEVAALVVALQPVTVFSPWVKKTMEDHPELFSEEKASSDLGPCDGVDVDKIATCLGQALSAAPQ